MGSAWRTDRYLMEGHLFSVDGTGKKIDPKFTFGPIFKFIILLAESAV